MKLITTTALALVAAMAATPAVAQNKQAPAAEQAQAKVTPSKGALKALSELQDAVQKNDVANIPAKVAAAQAVATTKEDKYLLGRLQLTAAIAAKDNAATSAAIDTMVGSGYLEPSKSAALYVGLGGTYFNNKEYPLAAAAYQKAMALDPSNTEAPVFLGESLFSQGQKAAAAAAFQRAIQARNSSATKADEALLKRAVAVAYDAQSPIAMDLARQWVSAYPSPASWSDAIAIYSNLSGSDIEARLDLYRLMQATGSLKTGGQYAQFARAAAEQNNFNEAQAVFDAGVAAKVVDPKSSDYSDLVQGLKAKPKATAADLETATKQVTNGNALVRIGDRYLAMGDQAKAIEVYKMAIAKPGTDVAVANLHLGMALAKAGDKAGATAALNAVTGPRADVAKLWLTYVNQKA
ncbi:MAG: tetratricopeptide repeat protein [Sphingomonas sp.]|nr:tetratricopeptide repeat protein [Sphingomonas sp.]MBW0007998.1 tetratricopeptide repeat protein [Sphingomonas sp.]